MSQQVVINRLKDLIAQDLDANIDREEIDDDVPLFEEGLGLDSVVLVELISLVEKEFKIKFADEELNPESFSTVKVLADVISSKQNDVSINTTYLS
ncbi:MAG: acyl carrier protein [Thioploca sp.]|nr:acyl carrier protein [Thioploca sp.]